MVTVGVVGALEDSDVHPVGPEVAVIPVGVTVGVVGMTVGPET